MLAMTNQEIEVRPPSENDVNLEKKKDILSVSVSCHYSRGMFRGLDTHHLKKHRKIPSLDPIPYTPRSPDLPLRLFPIVF